MRTYGQYCPIARGAEIFAERWTPLIIRNVHLGCETFGEILEGRPDSPAHSSRSGSNSSNASASSSRHRRPRGAVTVTSSRARATICSRSARPSARGELDGSKSPRRISIHTWRCGRCATLSDGTDFRPARSSGCDSPASAHERYWLLLERGEPEICKTYPGLDEDLYITADADAFVKWHAGQLSWAEATRDSRIQLDGPSWLVRAFPTWNRRSMFAHIKPAAGPVALGGADEAVSGRTGCLLVDLDLRQGCHERPGGAGLRARERAQLNRRCVRERHISAR